MPWSSIDLKFAASKAGAQSGPTLAFEIRNGAVHRRELQPADFGVPLASPADIQGGDKARNLAIARGVLAGERGAARDIVIVNAAAALVAAGRAETFLEGAAIASVSIDSGSARAKAADLAAFSQAASLVLDAETRRR